MSSFLRCFHSSPDPQEDSKKEKVNKAKVRMKDKPCCDKCSRRNCCEDVDDDLTDGKNLSKTLHITSTTDKAVPSSSSKKKGQIRRKCCCDANSASSSEFVPPGMDPAVVLHYGSLPSSAASVDPNGSPFFMTYAETYDLPGFKSYMPVSKDDPFYNMNHSRRGKAIVFNFDRWDNTNIPVLGLSPRQGSEKDKGDIMVCLQNLGFETEEHDNLKNLEFWAVIERIRTKEDHTDSDCLVVVIMTHGERNTIFMKDGTQIPINLVWEKFEAHLCPSLAGKPKIFIVQACRGQQYDSGTKLHSSHNFPGSALGQQFLSDVTDSSNFSYVIPNAADILVAFSCPLGHYSWRHMERGSWFIQAICKVFNNHAYDMDLQELFTTVAREVALNYQSSTTSIESNNKKQVTSTSSTLIRNIRFRPKGFPGPMSTSTTMVSNSDNNNTASAASSTSPTNGPSPSRNNGNDNRNNMSTYV